MNWWPGGAAIVGIYKRGFANSAPATPVVESPKPAGIEHKSKKFFNDIEAKLKEDASLVTKVKSIVGFTIGLPNNQSLSYVIDLKNAPGSVKLNDGSNKAKLFFDKNNKKFKPQFSKVSSPNAPYQLVMTTCLVFQREN